MPTTPTRPTTTTPKSASSSSPPPAPATNSLSRVTEQRANCGRIELEATMDDFLRKRKVAAVLREALEHSAYFAPTDFGLSRQELPEVARRMEIGDGEFDASLHDASKQAIDGSRRLRPRTVVVWSDLSHFKEPDLRNPDSFEFVLKQMASLKAAQADNPGFDRTVLVE